MQHETETQSSSPSQPALCVSLSLLPQRGAEECVAGRRKMLFFQAMQHSLRETPRIWKGPHIMEALGRFVGSSSWSRPAWVSRWASVICRMKLNIPAQQYPCTALWMADMVPSCRYQSNKLQLLGSTLAVFMRNSYDCGTHEAGSLTFAVAPKFGNRTMTPGSGTTPFCRT